MRVDSLSLKNYRNYKTKEITFRPGLNVVFGDNGMGKTNVVESIYFCSYLRSHRTKSDLELIHFDSDFAKISLKSSKDYEIIVNKNTKMCKINDLLVKKQSEYLGDLKVVFFSPETIDLLLKSPHERRKYLDLLLCVLDPMYVKELQQFSKIIKERNDYLKQLQINSLADKDFFDIITDKYVELSTAIYKKRYKLVEKLNIYIKQFFSEFFDFEIDLEYNVKYNFNFDNYSEELKRKLDSKYGKELQLGLTTVGPNRDDLDFLVDKRSAKFFSSKGQQRIVLISLKLAELFVIYDKFNVFPILILDDVLSELDKVRQNKLFNVLKEQRIQVIVTTASLHDISVGMEYNLIEI